MTWLLRIAAALCTLGFIQCLFTGKPELAFSLASLVLLIEIRERIIGLE